MTKELRLYTVEITSFPEGALRFYKDSDYDDMEPHEYDELGLPTTREEETFGYINPDWKPEGWLDDPEDREWWVERFKTDRFFWPKANKYYFSASGAKSRARLIESYGATTRVVRSFPIDWETAEKLRAIRIDELEAELVSLREAKSSDA